MPTEMIGYFLRARKNSLESPGKSRGILTRPAGLLLARQKTTRFKGVAFTAALRELSYALAVDVKTGVSRQAGAAAARRPLRGARHTDLNESAIHQ